MAIRSTVPGLLGPAAAQAAAFAEFVAGVPRWPVLALVTFIPATVQIRPILARAPVAVWLWVEGEIAMAVGQRLTQRWPGGRRA